tara:strand:- start:12 stop:764 length:753 start_codon:yes stop_codon:yes gene_type:complete
MRITIAGYGFVGKAMEAYFKRSKTQINIVDPKYKHVGIEHLNHDAVIICVNTPQNKDGSCDMSNIYNVTDKVDTNIPILIKSTISIEGWQELLAKYPKHTITFSPEFLRSETAIRDMLTCKEIYIGGGNVYWWERILKRGTVKVSCYDPEILILAKYFRNSFLATKVAFFNQVFDLCEATKLDYETVAKLITIDNRIGDSHTTVTNERGFGGHCFPKDMLAIEKTADQHNVNLSLISTAIEYNNKIRKEI